MGYPTVFKCLHPSKASPSGETLDSLFGKVVPSRGSLRESPTSAVSSLAEGKLCPPAPPDSSTSPVESGPSSLTKGCVGAQDSASFLPLSTMHFGRTLWTLTCRRHKGLATFPKHADHPATTPELWERWQEGHAEGNGPWVSLELCTWVQAQCSDMVFPGQGWNRSGCRGIQPCMGHGPPTARAPGLASRQEADTRPTQN